MDRRGFLGGLASAGAVALAGRTNQRRTLETLDTTQPSSPGRCTTRRWTSSRAATRSPPGTRWPPTASSTCCRSAGSPTRRSTTSTGASWPANPTHGPSPRSGTPCWAPRTRRR
ncbi:hypothetical protein DP107_01215 [Haloglomus irregulare]|uniref:Twin-arginine translocation signal domain-containing protein n=1 Tax=Haloglomus irregulare TaxID=2234134 RepID=A0A554NEL7_9EURY|nr:hypothetical protein DP107_01215 [Haloglomus irregulare]